MMKLKQQRLFRHLLQAKSFVIVTAPLSVLALAQEYTAQIELGTSAKGTHVLPDGISTATAIIRGAPAPAL